MNKKLKLFIIIFSGLAALCLIPALFPYTQKCAVKFVETYKNDDINDSFWMKQMFAFASMGIIFILLLNLTLFTEKGKNYFNLLKEQIIKTSIIVKQNKKYLFILAGLYFLGYFSIIRANFWNFAVDDLPRTMEGSREWVNFYRYFAEIGSIFIHTSMNIFDIAPLTQFIALVFISFASFFAISIFSDNSFSTGKCIAALPVGLSPFFLSNYSYRYDSPYMALSLFISVIPFLFRKDLRVFIISSVVCLFIMCTSYQASSGIYIFMAILVFVKMMLFENENSKTLFKFTVTSILSYALTLLFFSFLFIEQAEGGSYVDESLKLSMLLPNTITYLKTILEGLHKSAILIFSILVFLLFIINCTVYSGRHKLLAFSISTISLLVSIPLTFGSYLALGKPEFIPRAFIGIGVFLGCIAIFTTSITQKTFFLHRITSVILFCLSYSTLAFSFAFGNAQYDQKEYIKFRGTLLARDLSECITPSDEIIELLFVNDIGYAPSVEVLRKTYPLVSKSINKGFSGDRGSEFILESLNLISLKEQSNHNFKNEDFPVLKETLYHKIQAKDNMYLITFKTPKLKTVKTRTFINE